MHDRIYNAALAHRHPTRLFHDAYDIGRFPGEVLAAIKADQLSGDGGGIDQEPDRPAEFVQSGAITERNGGR